MRDSCGRMAPRPTDLLKMVAEDLLPAEHRVDGVSELLIQEAISYGICTGGEVREQGNDRIQVRVPHIQPEALEQGDS